MTAARPAIGMSRLLDVATRNWIGRPLALQVALDLTALLMVAATFAQLGDPDVILHVLWIVLALDAFAFGGQVAIRRIVIASAVVFGYAFIAEGEASASAAALVDLDLAEWPLMVAIIVLVAIMADRVALTGRRYAGLYRSTSDRLLTAQEDERKRLAADLHDGVGQTVTAIALTLDAAESMLWSSDQPPSQLSRDALRRAQELAAVALDEVRSVARRIGPQRLLETGLVAALRELAGDAGLAVAFNADERLLRPGLLPPEKEADAYRIVQEALGNAARHSGMRRAALDVGLTHTGLRIDVTDDGVGFDPSAAEAQGLGLAGMAERASSIGARLTLRSRPGRGTRVRLEVPLDPSVLVAVRGQADDRRAATAVAP